MRNILIGLLLVALCVMAIIVNSQSKKLKHFAEKQNEPPAMASLAVQASCAKQAAEAFKNSGYANQLFGYENHFNARLGKCLVLISNTLVNGKQITVGENLSDAFEGRVFGSYIWINPGNKKFWEVSPTECYVISPTGERKDCTSSDEFDDLTKTYME